MLRIRHYVSVNRIITAVFAVMVLFSATFAANAFFNEDKNACVFSRKTYYFSDASNTTVVGYSGYLCDGTFVTSGKKTRYTDTLYCDCEEDVK